MKTGDFKGDFPLRREGSESLKCLQNLDKVLEAFQAVARGRLPPTKRIKKSYAFNNLYAG